MSSIHNFFDVRPGLEDFKTSSIKGIEDTKSFLEEVKQEIIPQQVFDTNSSQIIRIARRWIHIPYIPALHRPGWLLIYICGPYNHEWAESIVADIVAGLTVGLTLIPQGLSYAQLANLPPICGLYSAVLPAAMYTTFGSSLQLAVGPVAIVSLLVGQIVAQYVPDYATNTADAIDCAAEVALAIGLTLVILSALNMGDFIRFISYPVMSGFTSGAACIIGLNQLKNAFGFSDSDVPQQGQLGFEYNYQVMQWYQTHWNSMWYYTPGQLTPVPSYNPTAIPTAKPTDGGSYYPSSYPTSSPSFAPTSLPTSHIPTAYPTSLPSGFPSSFPTLEPTVVSFDPTVLPTFNPTRPTAVPSRKPTQLPTSFKPSTKPSFKSYPTRLISYETNTLRNGQLYRNNLAVQICFSIFAVLMVVNWLKLGFKATAERKKMWSFRIWTIFSSLVPFFCIIIAAHITYLMLSEDNDPDATFVNPHTNYDLWSLKIVGAVPPGLNFLRTPNMLFSFTDIWQSSIGIALIAFMESYSVARKIAAANNQLHILNSSQELFANGLASLLAAVSTGYSVSGSYSRSALNAACDARTPLSKTVTMLVIITALSTLTTTFFYIPQAALAAIIWGAIFNLISFTDVWMLYKQNKQDCFTCVFTWMLVMVCNTESGLAGGLGVSVMWLLINTAFSSENGPVLYKKAEENNGIDIVLFRQDINFISAPRNKDFVIALFNEATPIPTEDKTLNEKIFHTISSTLDKVLIIDPSPTVKEMPKAVVLDLTLVREVDYTGVEAFEEILKEGRKKNVAFVFINVSKEVQKILLKNGFENDSSETTDADVDRYLEHSGEVPTRSQRSLKLTAPDTIDDIEVAAKADVDDY